MSDPRTHQRTWQQEEMQEAKQRYEQSEWVLNILRTQTDKPLSPAMDEDILLWHRQLNLNPD